MHDGLRAHNIDLMIITANTMEDLLGFLEWVCKNLVSWPDKSSSSHSSPVSKNLALQTRTIFVYIEDGLVDLNVTCSRTAFKPIGLHESCARSV